jgi:heme/copper-type cytochrome/quinol oxidase subunit 2
MKNRYPATLLLALPFIVAMVPAVAQSGRSIDVTVSRSAMVPEQIDLQVGERVRLHVTSTDGTHACQVKELRLDARISAGGATVTVDLTPTHAGIFPIECSDDRELDHGRARGRFVVTTEK